MRFFLLIFLSLATGCISVRLDPNKIKSSKQVSYLKPGGFSWIKSNFADRSWKDSNDNIISYHTECSNEPAPDVEVIFDKYVAGLLTVEDAEKTKFRYNDSLAIRTAFLSEIDSIKRQIDMVVFVKGYCHYNIMLVGRPDKISQAKGVFDDFIESFRVE